VGGCVFQDRTHGLHGDPAVPGLTDGSGIVSATFAPDAELTEAGVYGVASACRAGGAPWHGWDGVSTPAADY